MLTRWLATTVANIQIYWCRCRCTNFNLFAFSCKWSHSWLTCKSFAGIRNVASNIISHYNKIVFSNSMLFLCSIVLFNTWFSANDDDDSKRIAIIKWLARSIYGSIKKLDVFLLNNLFFSTKLRQRTRFSTFFQFKFFSMSSLWFVCIFDERKKANLLFI